MLYSRCCNSPFVEGNADSPSHSDLVCQVFPLHASMQQRQRLKNLDRFKASDNCVLVCTDVAARGLDIPNVDNVVHYQVGAHVLTGGYGWLTDSASGCAYQRYLRAPIRTDGTDRGERAEPDADRTGRTGGVPSSDP